MTQREETETETTGTHERRRRRDRTERAIEDVVDLGRIWAHHGLTIGKLALRTSARTFERSADLLAVLAEDFADPEERTPEAAAT